jgi:hypothetical protein
MKVMRIWAEGSISNESILGGIPLAHPDNSGDVAGIPDGAGVPDVPEVSLEQSAR